MNFFFGIVAFFLGHISGWFQLNLQKISPWWSDKALLSALLLGVPASISFWYGWKLVSEHMDSVWSARFVGSSVGYLVFPILTWFVLSESMFTTKTMMCLFLSILIILIQIFY